LYRGKLLYIGSILSVFAIVFYWLINKLFTKPEDKTKAKRKQRSGSRGDSKSKKSK
jgi:hypothetical protein